MRKRSWLIRQVAGICLLVGALCASASAGAADGISYADAKPLRFGPIGAESTSVAAGGKFELSFSLDATYDNPFDPDQIDVTAHFMTPSGGEVAIPAFFYVPFRQDAAGAPVQAGAPEWKVRFIPTAPGTYRYRITAKDRSGGITSPAGEMTCLPAPTDGFVRVSTAPPRRLKFDSGKPYLPLGFNLFISSQIGHPFPADRLTRCEIFVNRLADAGGNFVRLRMDSWWMAIEMTADKASGYRGLGWYQPETCWEIDQIYALAERRGIEIMHCLDNANSSVNLSPEAGNKNDWRRLYNLYAKENGGPCAKPADFWSDATAAKYVRQKLRYCVARWGYSRSLMCWEFWNEVACRADTIDAVTAWHRDMARYLRANDPYRHPITTSVLGDTSLFDRCWQLPEMEIAQMHVYREQDIAGAMEQTLDDAAKRWQKPFFFGEYGIGPIDGKEGNYEFDAQGVNIHNGLWGPVAAGGAGAGSFWYIEGYLDKLNMYPQYRSLADWAKDLPWNAPDLRPLQVVNLSFITPPVEKHPLDFQLPTSTKWAFQRPPEDHFTIGADGSISNAESLRPYLFADPGRRRPPIFILDCPRPAQFVVHVTASVGDERNRLLGFLDGKQVVDRPFPAGKGQGKSQLYIPQYDNWRSEYNDFVVIDLPAGHHEVKLDAEGKDRLEVAFILKDYLFFEDFHPLRVRGLQSGATAWFWAQNRLSTWSNLYRKVPLIPIRGMRATFGGCADGTYDVEWWDTWSGKVSGRSTAVARNGEISLDLPEISRDVACKLHRR